jgi:hypothetical protein
VSVLALALKRLALSRGTVPSAVLAGQSASGTNGTPGTLGTGGTTCGAFFDRDPINDADAIAERAALAADSVPACYLDAWARLQCQRPSSVDPVAWRRAIDDAGLFLGAWGADAATMRWTPGELFDVPRDGQPGGLVWRLTGGRVSALGEDRARLSDGRIIRRAEAKGPW